MKRETFILMKVIFCNALLRMPQLCICGYLKSVLRNSFIKISDTYHRTLHSHAPHNDVSVNDGPHIRRWSHNIIIPLCYNYLQYSVQ